MIKFRALVVASFAAASLVSTADAKV